ncbi:MAG TPA: tRNA epoxyqueuosine(34) reductase QueG [Planctomycetaceae bacterium]|nr:tRNA epoxyqueuosine(34) reductase QueG [Planctomycetaceae bacterium]
MKPSQSSKGTSIAELSRAVKRQAETLGFDLVGIAPAVRPPGVDALDRWLDRGFAGTMTYIERRRSAYEHPEGVLDGVRSLVVVGLNYRTQSPATADGTQARVSRYAWGDRDYHDVIREKLRRLSDFLHQHRPGCRTRIVVDTAPLLERSFAQLAGLGWVGKNTMLIHRRLGSWLFLGVMLTDVELRPDAPHATDHCGTCTRCLDACPTEAFPEPGVLDARRCISYLTIELRGEPIPHHLRSGLGRWLFGCDICQDVCPWNRKAPCSDEPAFVPRSDLNPVDAAALLRLDEKEFQRRFGQTPLHRPGRAGLLRNAALVLGNSRDPNAVPALVRALQDPEPLVRAAAAWALGQFPTSEARTALKLRLASEHNADVRQEIENALTNSDGSMGD